MSGKAADALLHSGSWWRAKPCARERMDAHSQELFLRWWFGPDLSSYQDCVCANRYRPRYHPSAVPAARNRGSPVSGSADHAGTSAGRSMVRLTIVRSLGGLKDSYIATYRDSRAAHGAPVGVDRGTL